MPASNRAEQEPLPLTLITGFLGSGKTTLMNHLITSEHTMRIGALVNEFGAIDVDSSLIVASKEITSGVVELSNGCICCTINESLCDALQQLLHRRDSLDALLLETSGIADPEPVMQTLQLPQFSGLLRLDAVVTVVDATMYVEEARSALSAAPTANGANRTAAVAASNTEAIMTAKIGCGDSGAALGTDATTSAQSEDTSNGASVAVVARDSLAVRRQLAMADLIVVNKLDLLPVGAADAAIDAAACGLSARVLSCTRGRVSAQLLLGQRLFDAAVPKAPPQPLGFVRSHADHDGFRSGAFVGNHRLSLEAFEGLRSSRLWLPVVRCKGFLRFAECPDHVFTLQMVGPRVEAVPAADDRDSEDGDDGDVPAAEKQRCRLVLIGGPELRPQLLIGLLRRCEAGEAGDACGFCIPVETITDVDTAGGQARQAADEARPGGFEGLHVGIAGSASALAAEAEMACGAGGASMRAAQAAVLAKRLRADPRFELEWQRGGVVAFRLPSWLGVPSRALNSELLHETNTQCKSTWLGVQRLEEELCLLQAPGAGPGAGDRRWEDIKAATERVMLRHFGGYFCGGCDCLEYLAGQVLV